MKRVFSVYLSIIVALTFVSCVYLEGQDRVFSLEKWISNVSELGEISSFRDLIDCWTKPGYSKQLGSTEDGTGEAWTYVVYEEYEGDNATLEFFDVVRGFFRRLFHALELFFDGVYSLLTSADKLLPWNATVPREELFDAV